tara:strand:+ start:10733 stop:12781 length:2049 start_codon:yes stop_codon:yes gene_type:complete
MKTFKYFISAFLLIAAVWSCTDDEFGSLDFVSSAIAPTNVSALYNVTQDNTGLVTITPNSDGAVSFNIYFGDETTSPAKVGAGKSVAHTYNEGSFEVKIEAVGITNLKTEVTQPLVVSFQAPIFGSEPIIANDLAVSKQVNVTVPDDGANAISFDVYFGEAGNDVPVTANIGGTASYAYTETGNYTIKVVLKGAAIATTEFTVADFEVTAILQPIESAPKPAIRLEADYISVYSDDYTNVADSNYNPDWGQSGQGSSYSEFDLNGNKMLNYINLSYQGIDLGSAIDASAMEFLHVDIWTADEMSIDIFPLPDGVQAADERFVTKTLVANEWNSFDIPLSEFTDQGLPLDNLKQFKFTGAPWAAGTVFIDNLYYYKSPTEFADLPITFDTALDTFEPFLDAEFSIAADPENAENKVGMITNHGQGWGWEGVKLALDKSVDVGLIPTIKLDFYNDGVTHDVLMKLEDSSSPLNGDGNPTVFEEVHAAVSNSGWSELVFNFTTGGVYDNVVLFVDGGVYDITGVYYFDNVRNEEFVALPLTMDSPGQAFEPFLDASFALATDPENPSNSVGMITNIGQGWGWEGVKLGLDKSIDISANPTILIDFYNDGVTHDVLMKLEDSTSPLNGDGNPTVFEEVHVSVSNSGWSELKFDFTSSATYDTIVLFVDGGVYDITGTYYFDNILQP